MKRTWLCTALIFGTFLAAPVQAQDAAQGRVEFETYCATCHGWQGHGDGPMTEVLSVAPPDLTTLSERNGGAFPLLQVMRRIDGRDPLLSHGGEMPLFGHHFDIRQLAVPGPGGQPIMASRTIVDLAAYLQQIQE